MIEWAASFLTRIILTALSPGFMIIAAKI